MPNTKPTLELLQLNDGTFILRAKHEELNPPLGHADIALNDLVDWSRQTEFSDASTLHALLTLCEKAS